MNFKALFSFVAVVLGMVSGNILEDIRSATNTVQSGVIDAVTPVGKAMQDGIDLANKAAEGVEGVQTTYKEIH